MLKKKLPKKAARKNTERWVAVSGGFDPLHVGHVRLFEDAKKQGDKLVVIINNDHWLKAKKGFVFMPQEERAEVILSVACVDKVVFTAHKPNDTDRSVCRELLRLRPAVFANGGDRKSTKDIPEAEVCREFGIKMVFNVGRGGKVNSSSWLVADASKKHKYDESVRPWGKFINCDSGKGWHLKTIYVNAGQRLSLQYHKKREEYWMLLAGDVSAHLQDPRTKKVVTTQLKRGELFFVPKGATHRMSSKKGGVIAEIAYGVFEENDIVRLEDDYNRVKR